MTNRQELLYGLYGFAPWRGVVARELMDKHRRNNEAISGWVGELGSQTLRKNEFMTLRLPDKLRVNAGFWQQFQLYDRQYFVVENNGSRESDTWQIFALNDATQSDTWILHRNLGETSSAWVVRIPEAENISSWIVDPNVRGYLENGGSLPGKVLLHGVSPEHWLADRLLCDRSGLALPIINELARIALQDAETRAGLGNMEARILACLANMSASVKPDEPKSLNLLDSMGNPVKGVTSESLAWVDELFDPNPVWEGKMGREQSWVKQGRLYKMGRKGNELRQAMERDRLGVYLLSKRWERVSGSPGGTKPCEKMVIVGKKAGKSSGILGLEDELIRRLQ